MDVGLVGVFSTDAPFRNAVLAMEAALLPVASSRWVSLDEPGVTLRARVAPWVGSIQARDEATETLLVVIGAPYDGEKQTSAARLLPRFVHGGESVLTSLNGSFLILVSDWQRRRLLLVTDRLGTKKLFVYPDRKGIVFSTELRALLAHHITPRRIDEIAVGHFLITSHLLDTRSLIEGVNILPPASVVTIEADGLSSRKYWRPRVEPCSQDDLNRWADRIAETVSAAVRSRCGDDSPVLPLSGGLDSRTVAAFIPKSSLPATTTYSFGHSHCYDVRYGRAVARALGAPFRFLPLPSDFFRTYLASGISLTDGEVSIEALPMLRLLGAADTGRKIVTGFLGDVLSGGHLLELDSFPDEQAMLDHIWRKLYQRRGFSEVQLESVLTPSRYHAIAGSPYQLMIDALQKVEADSLTDKAMLLELIHRQSRYISYLGRILASQYRAEAPFLDAEVIDTFLQMPLEFRRNQRAYRRMLVRHAPAVASLREIKTHRSVINTDRHGLGPPVRAGTVTSLQQRFPEGVDWRLNKLRRLAGSLLATGSAGWIGAHNRNHYVHHDESIRSVDTAWFRDKLNQDELLEGWFNKSALNVMLDEHLDRKADHSIRINNVITFLEWRRLMDV